MSFKSFGAFLKRSKLNTGAALTTAYVATKTAVNDTIEGYKNEGVDTTVPAGADVVIEAEIVTPVKGKTAKS